MPLLLTGNPIVANYAEYSHLGSTLAFAKRVNREQCINIALINNMPDAALEDTELQFAQLLDRAAGDVSVRLTFYSLPGISRGSRGLERISAYYSSMRELWNSQVDAAIVTGTEPHHACLPDEPYWGSMKAVLDWAEQNTFSMVLSCLAAHAAVLHSDGIQRRPLADKRFGVFECQKTCDHALTRYTADTLRFPHSRWNEVPEEALASCGYSILVRSAEAGVDLFVKRKKDCLFGYLQGHPEYGAHTLFKEYRRDIRRYLRHERETYPTAPHGYFPDTSCEALSAFRAQAEAARREDMMEAFPEAVLTRSLRRTWGHAAVRLYRNWIQYILQRKANTAAQVVLTQASA